MTRLWFEVSIPYIDYSDIYSLFVEDVQPVVNKEIWSIKIKDRRKKSIQSYYILESTCEVIGSSESSLMGSSNISQTSITMRVDWSNYITQYQSTEQTHDSPSFLLNRLKTPNAEEYYGGISKVWISRVEREGDLGAYKKTVAKRYIIACVVGNRYIFLVYLSLSVRRKKLKLSPTTESISGRWMSSAHMAQVFAGSASSDEIDVNPRRQGVQKVNLFLPEYVHCRL